MRTRQLAAALIAMASLATPSMAGVDEPTAAPSTKPNVVLILVDDARVDDMSSIPQVTSLIGDKGATYVNTYSPFPLCCPARATILTGQYAHNHGVLDNEPPLGGFPAFDDSHTLATWLADDYTTGLIGKYLNAYKLPYRPPGWDHWMVPVGSLYDYRGALWNVDGVDRMLSGYRTHATGMLATQFIEAHADDPQPFLLYTAIVAPHVGTPVEPDDPNRIYSTTIFPTPNVSDIYRNTLGKVPNTDPSFNEADVSDKPVRPSPLAPWEIDALKEVNGQRREALLSAQNVVQDIVNTLRTTGELGNTYLIFVSDNGFILGDHRIRGGKVFPYEVSARVPMLIRGPGIPAGSVVNQTVGLQDLAPTILAMTDHTGANGRFPIDGVNILPMIGDPNLRASRPQVLEAGPKTPTTTAYRFHGAVAKVDGIRWKYIERDGGDKELYNLGNDPAELTNVAGQAAFASVQSRMRTILLAYEWCAGATCR
ncbi:MAG TPA: sulfatase [Nocardioidaceae bacterium]|nr:sulfatase [Nocardioidaceae bacterium]